MAMVDVDGSSHLWQTHNPSQLAWSEGWRPPGAHQMNRVNSRSDHGYQDSTINSVVELLLFFIFMTQHTQRLQQLSATK